jgi:hypothetical protein
MPRFMSPLPVFTLEALITSRQWTAEQRAGQRKATPAKIGSKGEKVGADPKAATLKAY